jgi:hypothetical protein
VSDTRNWVAAAVILIGFVLICLLGPGCAHAPPAHPIAAPQVEYRYVKPDCEAPNVLERCRLECMEKKPSQQAIAAMESATSYRCACGPFDL